MSTMIFQVLERDLPSLPPSVAVVLAELGDPTTIDVQLVISELEKTPQIGENVVKIINSGYLKARRKADNIRDAILLVGIPAARNIILAVLLKILFPQRGAQTVEREAFLRHCIGTAVASEMLSGCVELEGDCDRHRMITYGFTHDIGTLALDYAMPFTLQRIHALAKAEGVSLLEAEVRVLDNITHATVGEWVSNYWDLPRDISNVIKYHHTPRQAQENREELLVIHLGDLLSMNYYEAMVATGHIYKFDPTLLELLGLTMKQVEEIQEALPEKVDRVYKVLDMGGLDAVSL